MPIWRLFENFWLPIKPFWSHWRLYQAPIWALNGVQTRNDSTWTKTDQHWLGEGITIFCSFSAKFIKMPFFVCYQLKSEPAGLRRCVQWNTGLSTKSWSQWWNAIRKINGSRCDRRPFITHSDKANAQNFSSQFFHCFSPTWSTLSPFTPKSDQVQISPAASPVILHHKVWRTWLFIAYSHWKMIIVPILITSLTHFSLKGWENVLIELGSERVKGLFDNQAAFPLRQPC